MTLRRSLRVVVGAVAAGLIFGLAFSGEEGISIEVWAGTSAVTVVAVTMRGLLRASALEPATMTPAWAPTADAEPTHDAGGLLSLRSLVSLAQSNPRVHSQRLRSHLLRLAGHFLPLRHGLDLGRDETQVTALLGDVHWLIDPAVNDRSPTTTDLERFLDIVMGEEDVQPTKPSPEGAAMT